MEWLLQLDKGLFQTIHAWRSTWLDPVFVTFTDAGLGQIQAAALLSVAAIRSAPGWSGRGVALFLLCVAIGVGLAQNDLLFQSLGLLLTLLVVSPLSSSEGLRAVLVAAIAGVARLGIVAWADRLRPSNFAFAQPLEHVYGPTSFPSGHSTTAFAIAFTVLLSTWNGPRRWCGWLALAYALGIGLSRVYVGVHYPTDVLAGAGLALVVACGFRLALDLPNRCHDGDVSLGGPDA